MVKPVRPKGGRQLSREQMIAEAGDDITKVDVDEFKVATLAVCEIIARAVKYGDRVIDGATAKPKGALDALMLLTAAQNAYVAACRNAGCPDDVLDEVLQAGSIIGDELITSGAVESVDRSQVV